VPIAYDTAVDDLLDLSDDNPDQDAEAATIVGWFFEFVDGTVAIRTADGRVLELV
jgi:hypothetical protein